MLYNYVYFNIVNTDNNDFKEYIESLSGNAFVANNAIGLGCIENNILFYSNNSDEFGFKEYKLSEIDSNKIIESTNEKPIKLRLERFNLSLGGGAPTCYSHITNIKVID